MLWLAAVGAAPAAQPRIVAVGDLHGDFDAWTQIARAAGLIDAGGHWAAGKTILVQLGDITDRGPDSLKIIRNLQQLESEAPAAGGKVVVVLGNHEAMNLVGDNRYTTPGEYAAFADDRSPARRERLYAQIRQKLEAEARQTNPNILPSQVREQWLAKTPLGMIEHQLAWSPKGELGKWAARNPAVIKIGDTVFAHGGVSEEYSKLSIDEIDARTARAMASADDTPKSILNDPLGPLWYRGLVTRDPDAESRRGPAPHPAQAQELEDVLAAYGAKRLVIAHTPTLNGIAITNDGRLYRIDTGISRYYGGPLSWLEIVGDRVTPHQMKRAAP
ncbi:MAG TPA: metallophosphoesterase [Sphingomicrobium sp.]